MLFNSVDFLIFFPIAVLVYYVLPKKVRYLWLLAASYYFYMQWNAVYILLLFGCTLVTYLGSLLIEHNKNQTTDNEQDARRLETKQKLTLTICLLVCLGILGFYKYFGFAVDMLNGVLSLVHIAPLTYEFNIILPVGISFFTLQSLGYLIDVYRGDIYAERNFFRYALFVSFFPQLVAGPIERSKNLLKQLYTPQPFTFENMRRGLLLMLYGIFLKVVIADRAAAFVDTVYGNVIAYPGWYIVIATLLFAVQIYCDFYGYSVIARGAALVMGIHLIDNFKAPYYSKSIKECWARWHISLSTWFRDYLYIPLGGNRKGKLRKFINLMIVFLVSGLWHGASLSFVLWGALNAIFQIIGEGKNVLASRFEKRFHLNTERSLLLGTSLSARLFQGIGTFLLFDFTWLFFRARGISASRLVLKSMFGINNYEILFNGDLYGLGISENYMHVLLISILVLMIVDYFKYKGHDLVEAFFRQNFAFRLIAEMALIFTVLLFGCYGEMYDVGAFIYFQF